MISRSDDARVQLETLRTGQDEILEVRSRMTAHRQPVNDFELEV